MKLLFSVQDQVHTFTVTEELVRTDLATLKAGISRFLESKPSFVVLDFSQATLMIPDTDLQLVIQELKTIALSRQIDFYVAYTDIESIRAHRAVVELALTKKVKILQNKVEIREKMQAEAEKLLSENQRLKLTVTEQMERLKILNEKTKNRSESISSETNFPETESLIQKLSPILEKLWSEK